MQREHKARQYKDLTELISKGATICPEFPSCYCFVEMVWQNEGIHHSAAIMITISPHSAMPPGAVSPRHALLEELVSIVLGQVSDGLPGLCSQLAAVLGEGAAPAGPRCRAASLLRDRCHVLMPIAARSLEHALREELARLAPQPQPRAAGEPLALVPYEVMDQRVALGAIARPFDEAHADALAALGARLAQLSGRAAVHANPFRPEVFIAALRRAWLDVDSQEGSVSTVLALLQPGRFHDLGTIYAALDRALERHGVPSGARQRPWARPAAHDGRRQAGLSRQLQAFFARTGTEDPPAGSEASLAGALDPHLQAWLASLPQGEAGTGQLPALRRHAPPGMLSRADESTIDLLSAVFDTVAGDGAISPESRELLQLLQLPLLKAALADRDFFFHDEHPARRLLELLSHLGWERTLRGGARRDDSQFQAMRRSVDRAASCDSGDGDEAVAAFAQAVRELEAALQAEEAQAASAIAAPVAAALKQEKTAAARRAARDTVAMRIGTGEVVAVVEAFLENKWTDVLTVAYSIDGDKPGAVRHATQAMDDLLWSVRPKPDAQERKGLIARLPALLATLNRWLDVIRWQDADRLRFFAELAECHASIVRAPLDMPPERRLELALQATQLAAERRQAHAARREQATAAAPAPTARDELAGLARGTWFELAGADGPRKVRLAWISPLRTLFIFSNGAREEAFSLPADDLAQRLRAGTATVLQAEGVMLRALSRALAVNDADAHAATGASAA